MRQTCRVFSTIETASCDMLQEDFVVVTSTFFLTNVTIVFASLPAITTMIENEL